MKGKAVLSMATIPGRLSNLRHARMGSYTGQSDTLSNNPDTPQQDAFNQSATGLKNYYHKRIHSNNASIDENSASLDEKGLDAATKESSDDERGLHSPATIGRLDDSSDTSEPSSRPQTRTKPFLTSDADGSSTLPFVEGEGKPFSHASMQDTDIGTYSDGEADWATSTPKKIESNRSFTLNNSTQQDSYTWIAPDNDNTYV